FISSLSGSISRRLGWSSAPIRAVTQLEPARPGTTYAKSSRIASLAPHPDIYLHSLGPLTVLR
ncbi:hypothetical protein GT037_007997, partial [Alternaria burnsii]